MIYYHATTIPRSNRIEKEGLKPKGSRPTSPHSDQRYVFVFNSVQMAIGYARILIELGKAKKEAALLVIDGTGIVWEADPCWDICNSFVTKVTIPPERILDAQRIKV